MHQIFIENIQENQSKIDIIRSFVEGRNLEVEFIYRSDFRNTKDIRDFIEAIGKFFCLPNKFISRLILISDELNNNAIEYGTDKNGNNILRMFVENKDDSIFLKLEVEDNGKGKAPKTPLEMETMRAHKLKRGYFHHNSIRGRGLFLITVQIADRLYFKKGKQGGLIVGIKKTLKKD